MPIGLATLASLVGVGGLSEYCYFVYKCSQRMLHRAIYWMEIAVER
jgi:hypothetical protein